MQRIEVSEWIGKGGQHMVGRSPEGKIIKYPHIGGKSWDFSTAKSVDRDLRLHDHWKIPIPETHVLSNVSIDDGSKIIKSPYAIISEEIKGRILREMDLDEEAIKEQLQNILKKSLEIRQKIGRSIDFLGGEAGFHFLLYLFKTQGPGQLGAYNMRITESGELILIDTSTLNPKRAPNIMKWIVDTFIDLQHSILSAIVNDPELIQLSYESNKYRAVTRFAERIFKRSRVLEAKRAQ